MRPQPSEKWLRGILAFLETMLPAPHLSDTPKYDAISSQRRQGTMPLHLQQEPTAEGGPQEEGLCSGKEGPHKAQAKATQQ